MMVLNVADSKPSLLGLIWIGYANSTTACELIRNGIIDVMNAQKKIDKERSIYYTIDKFWFYSMVDDFKLEDLQAEIDMILKNKEKWL